MGIIEIENKIRLRIILFGNENLKESFFSSFFLDSKKKKRDEEKYFYYYFYDLFPRYEFITIKDESIDKLRNFITKKEMRYIVIFYFSLETDGQDIQLIQGISQLDEKYHPFIFF